MQWGLGCTLPIDPDSMKNASSVSPISTNRLELAFPVLTDDMLSRIRSYGKAENVAMGTQLMARGDREVDMFVVLSGKIEVYVHNEHEAPRLLAAHSTGEFSGEFDLISSRQTLADAFAATDSELLRIPRPELRRLMRAEGDIANLIMQAAIWRRIVLIEGEHAGIVLLGDCTSAETIKLQTFLTRNSYPHRLLEPSEEQTSRNVLGEQAAMASDLPAILFPDGRLLRRPTISQLADELGLIESLDPLATWDVAVVGAGPSGLAAAVYAASEGLSVIIIESLAPGGQAGTSSKIENYLGFPTGISGLELAGRAQAQAQKFGARLVIAREAALIEAMEGFHRITLSNGSTVRSSAVVVATGARYCKLSTENYKRFEDHGIHYAATALEAGLCKEQEVVVTGGGNSAGQAAVFLSGLAKHVHIVVRGPSLAHSMSRYLIERIESSSHITLHVHTQIESLRGDTVLEEVTWLNTLTQERETRKIAAMFVMIGAQPNSGWLAGTVALDNKGFILTGGPAAFDGSRYATNVPGIYAVGDIRSDSVKRVASAVGEGSVVVSDVHRYLSTQAGILADTGSVLAAAKAVNANAKDRAT
jgi:thioredoxin reductase (NADPH)